ncbi:MAG: peptidylprolyl isomerase [Anaerolineae bacterium]
MSKRSRKAAAQPAAPTQKQMHISRRAQQRQRQLWIIFGSILAVIGVVLVAALVQQYWLKPRAPIATVNGAAVTTSAYQDRFRYEDYRILQRFGALAGSPQIAQQISQYVQQQLPNQVFESMITEEMLRQEAAKQNYAPTDAEVTKALQAQFDYYPAGTPTPTVGAATSTPQPSPTAGAGTVVPTPGPTETPAIVTADQFKKDYDQYLSDLKAQTGLTESYVQDYTRTQLIYDHFRNQAIADAKIPQTTQQVRAKQIVLASEDDAKRVVERLKAGEDFAAVAKAVSTDTQTKDSGGDLGWFAQGTYDAVIEKAAFTQPVGQISDPIQNAGKWVVLVVTDAPQQRPITDTDRQKKEQSAVDAFLGQLQAKAAIERNFRADIVPSVGQAATSQSALPVPVPTSR